MCYASEVDEAREDPGDALAGSDPIDYEDMPFAAAEQVVVVLSTTEADVWGGWYLTSGLVDPAVVHAGGDAAIDEIWAGVLRAVDAGWFGSCTWSELAAAGRVPLWVRIRPGYESYLGAAGCWVTAGFIAMTCRWMERELGARWSLPPDQRGLDRSEPVIAAPGFRGILPLSQFVGTVGRAVGLVPSRINRDPARLRELIELHRMSPEELADDVADDLEGPIVDPADGEGRWLIGFSDVQAYDEDERVDRFAAAMADELGVVRCYREDRELVVVEGPLDQDRVQAAAERVWFDCADE